MHAQISDIIPLHLSAACVLSKHSSLWIVSPLIPQHNALTCCSPTNPDPPPPYPFLILWNQSGIEGGGSGRHGMLQGGDDGKEVHCL